MTAVLPQGLTSRPIRDGDQEAVAAQMGAYTAALIGFPKYTLDDITDYLRDPKLTLATDSWLVFDGDDLVGTGTAVAHSDSARINLDLFASDSAVAAWLLDRSAARAVERATADGRQEVTLSVSQVSEDDKLRSILTERGFALETSIERMRVDHTSPVDRPEIPAGVVVRRGALDDATRRAAHAVITEAFADQPAAVPRPYDDWLASREVRSTFDWSQLTVLEIDGRTVAYRECSDNFLRSENCGYIGRLAVAPVARGRGLAKYLLRDQFALDAAGGRAGTILHVDNSNPTPAVGLYRAVGMRPTLTSHVWTKRVVLS